MIFLKITNFEHILKDRNYAKLPEYLKSVKLS
jgi:hypothetical protein